MPDQTFLGRDAGEPGTRSRDRSLRCGRSCLQTAHSNWQSGNAANRSARVAGSRCGLAAVRACGAGQPGSGLAVRAIGGAALRCRSAGVWACGAGHRRCGLAVRVSGGAGLPREAAGKVEALGQGRPRHGCRGMSVWPGLYSQSGAPRKAPGGAGPSRYQACSIRAGRPGPAEHNSPDAQEYSAFFDRLFNGAICARLGTRALLSDRSFSGGNLRAPLYKGPLVQ
jgi:hypothetical protein